ncbi:hypothetical protein [Mitsuokella sp. oral taxon 131]|uniref:hypothetical protein n=1 Tax=Mitsuokella sp. oral taxon 131 TaxID=1321780 RepID=UPI000590114D|nr:hypothetical protein [Mitsuokella sp. oral taxon 131]
MGLSSSNSEKKKETVYYSPSEVLNAVYDNAHANNDMIAALRKDVRLLLEQNKELLERVKRLEDQSPASRSERIPLSVAR